MMFSVFLAITSCGSKPNISGYAAGSYGLTVRNCSCRDFHLFAIIHSSLCRYRCLLRRLPIVPDYGDSLLNTLNSAKTAESILDVRANLLSYSRANAITG